MIWMYHFTTAGTILYKKKTSPKLPLASWLKAVTFHKMSLGSQETKMYVLPPPPDLAASVTNPACTSADGSVDPRSRSVIGRRGAKLYCGKRVCASETRG